MQTTTNRVIVTPVYENSPFILKPAQSRWQNGRMSICGKVVAVGPGKRIKRVCRPPDVKIGQYVYHSDSCGEFIENGRLKVIREDDIMFVSDDFVKVDWLGAEENYE